MVKTKEIKIMLMVPLMLLFIWGGLFSNPAAGQTDPFLDTQKKIEGITGEKREILQKLFTLTKEIEEMELEEDEIAGDIEKTREEGTELERLIDDEERAFAEKRDVLEQVLKSYQRRGPGTYLEILLNSENLSMFLRKLNTFRDLARNTGELLDSLEESKEKLAGERKKLAEKVSQMEDKQEILRINLAEQQKKKVELERHFQSMEEESEYYREQLADIESSWNRLMALFPEITKEISRIIEEGDFPPDAWKITFSLTSIRGSIEEKTFNELTAKNSLLSEMIINFQPGKAELNFPNKFLVLTGSFVVQEGKILKFQAEEGSFYGFPLSPGAVGDLFQENDLLFNFKALLGSSMINSVEIMDGYLEFNINSALF